MSNLQVHNSFEPYYAGRNSEGTKWTARKKVAERIERSEIDPSEDRLQQSDTGKDITDRAERV
jgi:hypothetical protein